MHIELDDDMVDKIDRVAGPRGRSKFVREAIESALRWTNDWEAFERAFGSIPDQGHEWDEDPAAWVHRQRFSDPRQVG